MNDNEQTPDHENRSQGTDRFALAEPWPEAVVGAELLEELRSAFRRHVVLPEQADVAVAIWVLHAYAHNAFRHSPVLGIVSPVLGCGKTTLLSVLRHTVPKPLMSSSWTPASIFRVIDKYGPTLLIDEGDTFLDGHKELSGILNSGHSKDGAAVIRCDGEDYQPNVYSTWAPKAIARIGALSPTLESRAIQIPLRRRLAHEKVEPFTTQRISALADLRQKAVRWVNDSFDEIRDCEPVFPDGLANRAADNWRPLLSIAEIAGGAWPELAQRSAAVLSPSTGEAGPLEIQLLGDVREVFRRKNTDRIKSKDLCSELARMEESSWGDRASGGISVHRIAKLLKPFGIYPKDVWIGGSAYKGYTRDAMLDAFRRYLPEEPREGQERAA